MHAIFTKYKYTQAFRPRDCEMRRKTDFERSIGRPFINGKQ